MRVSTLTSLILACLAAVCLSGSAAAGAAAPPTAEQLALMPLPKSSLPAAARSLPLDRDSGVETNKDAADDATGLVTAHALGRMGRLTGYGLNYADNAFTALANGNGLLSIQTSVDLYRDARAAREGMAFWLEDETTFAGLKPSGVVVSFRRGPAPRLGQERFSFVGSITVGGMPPIYAVDVVFRVGALIGDVTVTTADPESGRAIVASLARKLDARIRGVLSGKIKGPPVPLPGKAKAGPPPNGMDLTAMAIRPSDLGAGKVSRQGYRLDPDLSPVSEFARELSGSPFAAFESRVALFHSATEAKYTISLLASTLIVNQKAKQKPKPGAIASAKTTEVKVDAGDEARAMLQTVGFGDGTSVNQGFVLVRVGSVVAYVSVGMPGTVKIPGKVLVQLGRLAAARVADGLNKSGVA